MTFYQVFGLQFEDFHDAVNYGLNAAGDDEIFTIDEVIKAADGKWEVIDTVVTFDMGQLRNREGDFLLDNEEEDVYNIT